MLKQISLCAALVLVLCSIGTVVRAQGIQFFPPSNYATGGCTGGSLLYWDGSNAVKCVQIPTNCPAGQLPVFANDASGNPTIKCENAGATAGGVCAAGKVPVRPLAVAHVGVDRGTYLCCAPGTGAGDPSCESDAVPLSSCIPSGFPTGQPNAYYPNTLYNSNPTQWAWGDSTQCGNTGGWSANCCSKTAQWAQYGTDNWNMLSLMTGPPDLPSSSPPASNHTFVCLCR